MLAGAAVVSNSARANGGAPVVLVHLARRVELHWCRALARIVALEAVEAARRHVAQERLGVFRVVAAGAVVACAVLHHRELAARRALPRERGGAGGALPGHEHDHGARAALVGGRRVHGALEYFVRPARRDAGLAADGDAPRRLARAKVAPFDPQREPPLRLGASTAVAMTVGGAVSDGGR